MVERQFRFHGSQVGRAKAAFEAGGFMPYIYPLGDGMYLIAVLLPESIGNVDWDTLDGWQNKQRKGKRLVKKLIRIGIIVTAIAVIAGICYFGFQMAAAMGLHLPWSGQAAQPATHAPSGFQLPELPLFDKAQEAPKNVPTLKNPLQMIGDIVDMTIRFIVVLCVLLILFLLRGFIWQIGVGIVGFTKGKGKQ